jgi:hypothetical protein
MPTDCDRLARRAICAWQACTGRSCSGCLRRPSARSRAPRRAPKAEAALRGRKLKDLIEEGLRRVLETPRGKRRQPSLAGLMKPARGTIDSGIANLASNPKHLAGFGRNDRRHR